MPTCGKCGKESCGHRQPGNNETWDNGRIVSSKTGQPVSGSRSTGTVSKRLGSELEKLHKLLICGALTQNEYQAAKKKLIGD